MRTLFAILILTTLAFLAACERSKFLTYDGPAVTRVLLFKDERRLYLMHHDKVLADYDIGLGFAPDGHKEYEGDGRTPEGHYLIDRRNPNSRYHLSIGINYPNQDDMAHAETLGKKPGGDIFIHGRGPSYMKGSPGDWTHGCIAVTDREMEKIYSMVQNNTPISIYPTRQHMLEEMALMRAAAEASAAAPLIVVPDTSLPVQSLPEAMMPVTEAPVAAEAS